MTSQRNNSALTPLAWRDSWLLGIEAVDADHKELVRLLNLLLCAEGRCAESFAELETPRESAPAGSSQLAHFSNLLGHLRDHFRREEALMMSLDYPDFELHESEHRMQMAELIDLRRHLSDRGSRCLSEESLEWIKRCSFDHFVTEDRRLAEFYLRELGA
ncbi:MAG: hemerythrin domain-containing protein [Pseudomonadota bacterium]|nr:hemerythrin domain-containing protein [Pseudomonadota bacterium]